MSDTLPVAETPIPSSWFADGIQHEGPGRAEFADPRGFVEGHAAVATDSAGRITIRLTIERYEVDSEHAWPIGLHELLSGIRAHRNAAGQVEFPFTGDSATCPCVRIDVPGGFLHAEGNIQFASQFNIGGGSNYGQITLHPTSLIHDVDGAGQATSWAVPLSNYVAAFVEQHSDLDRHILRIFPTPVVPGGLSQEEHLWASLRANVRNRLTVYSTSEGLGFIEGLPDYDARVKELRDGTARIRVTALMVGPVGNRDINDLDAWFPFHYLPLLSLATGTEVGAPWIELRDVGGELVRRIHRTHWTAPFTGGRRVFDEQVHAGTGAMLTACPTAPLFRGKPLVPVIMDIVRGGADQPWLAQSLRSLFVALDRLTLMGSTTQPKQAEDFLGEDAVKGLQRILSEAASAIRQLPTPAREGIDVEEVREYLQDVAQGIETSSCITIGFGRSVVALLREVGLKDPAVMAALFATRKIAKRKSWERYLGYLRGKVIHQGTLPDLSDPQVHEDVIATWLHLHDTLVRCILTMSGFRGMYMPTVYRWAAAEPVDWVQDTTAPARLGFKNSA